MTTDTTQPEACDADHAEAEMHGISVETVRRAKAQLAHESAQLARNADGSIKGCDCVSKSARSGRLAGWLVCARPECGGAIGVPPRTAAHATRLIGTRDYRGTATVLVEYTDGAVLSLPMATDDRGRDESNGFEWGYAGQGPHALAVAVLAFALGITASAGTSTHRALWAAGYDSSWFARSVVSCLPSTWSYAMADVVLDCTVAKVRAA